LRNVAFVPVPYGPKIPSVGEGEEESEEYCRAMLILFKPWRCISDLKTESTWRDSYLAYEFPPYLRRIIANIQLEQECSFAR
ncbi:hypothetical protein FA95DRAFT_1456037, partial [Auriscalpium vulgare]